MAYDEGLAQRVRELPEKEPDFQEKKMFGGLVFSDSGEYGLRHHPSTKRSPLRQAAAAHHPG
jgi:hypothetical protein